MRRTRGVPAQRCDYGERDGVVRTARSARKPHADQQPSTVDCRRAADNQVRRTGRNGRRYNRIARRNPLGEVESKTVEITRRLRVEAKDRGHDPITGCESW